MLPLLPSTLLPFVVQTDLQHLLYSRYQRLIGHFCNCIFSMAILLICPQLLLRPVLLLYKVLSSFGSPERVESAIWWQFPHSCSLERLDLKGLMQLTGNKLYITCARDAWHLLTSALALWCYKCHTYIPCVVTITITKNVDSIE